MDFAFSNAYKNSSPKSGHKDFYLIFYSEILYFTFYIRSVILFELILVKGLKTISSHLVFSYRCLVVEKTVSQH